MNIFTRQRRALLFATVMVATAFYVSGCATHVSAGNSGYNGTQPVANAAASQGTRPIDGSTATQRTNTGTTSETPASATLTGNRDDNANNPIPMPKPKAAVYIMGNPEGRDALRMAVNTFLVKSGKYQMIAVDAIDIVAQEHQRQMSGSVSDAQIAKLGYDAGAQYVCVVERTELDGYSYVATRMVSVESKVAEFADMVKLPHGGDIIEFIHWQIGSMLGMAVGARPAAAVAAPANTSPAYEAPAQSTPATQGGTMPTQIGISPSANTSGKYMTVKVVKIGNQIWMAENLNIKTGKSWSYKEDNSYCDKYGRLYDWNTAQKVCPSGWHLPSRQEWDDLVDAAGGKGVAAKKLKSTSGWNSNGTNNYGFSALPGGSRGYSYPGDPGGGFGYANQRGFWWTASSGGMYANYWWMGSNSDRVDESKNIKDCGYSVRCVRD